MLPGIMLYILSDVLLRCGQEVWWVTDLVSGICLGSVQCLCLGVVNQQLIHIWNFFCHGTCHGFVVEKDWHAEHVGQNRRKGTGWVLVSSGNVGMPRSAALLWALSYIQLMNKSLTRIQHILYTNIHLHKHPNTSSSSFSTSQFPLIPPFRPQVLF